MRMPIRTNIDCQIDGCKQLIYKNLPKSQLWFCGEHLADLQEAHYKEDLSKLETKLIKLKEVYDQVVEEKNKAHALEMESLRTQKDDEYASLLSHFGEYVVSEDDIVKDLQSNTQN